MPTIPWTLGLLALGACLVVGEVESAEPATGARQPESRTLTEATRLLETWIESLIDFERLPGLTLAVIHDQQTVYARGFGYIDAHEQVAASPNAVYSICSIAKLFTAIAVLQLRDGGRLSLDDPVAEHLPWFAPEGAEAPPTLRDLLRHSGGLPCEPDTILWPEPEDLYPSSADLIARASGLRLSYPANSSFNYSNLGYALLGAVVSQVSGEAYEDYVQQRILEPLGMTATTLGAQWTLLGNQLATGYGRWPRKGSRAVIPNLPPRAMTPALGFASTVTDLGQFAKWQFRVLGGKDNTILNRETLEEMQSVQWPDPTWGLGFTIWRVGGRKFVGHQGGCPGYKSQFILCPEEKTAVVVMINATDAPQYTLALRAYETMAPALNPAVAETDAARDWSSYTGSYTADRSWSEAEVLEWGGELAVLWIPTENPLGCLVRLKHLQGGIFRQHGDDGKLGKHYIFETDRAGNAVAMKFNNNILKKSSR